MNAGIQTYFNFMSFHSLDTESLKKKKKKKKTWVSANIHWIFFWGRIGALYFGCNCKFTFLEISLMFALLPFGEKYVLAGVFISPRMIFKVHCTCSCQSNLAVNFLPFFFLSCLYNNFEIQFSVRFFREWLEILMELQVSETRSKRVMWHCYQWTFLFLSFFKFSMTLLGTWLCLIFEQWQRRFLHHSMCLYATVCECAHSLLLLEKRTRKNISQGMYMYIPWSTLTLFSYRDRYPVPYQTDVLASPIHPVIYFPTPTPPYLLHSKTFLFHLTLYTSRITRLLGSSRQQ